MSNCSSNELTDGLKIVYLTSLCTFSICTIVSLFLWFYSYSKATFLIRAFQTTLIKCSREECALTKEMSTNKNRYRDYVLHSNKICLSFDALTRAIIIFSLNSILYGILLMGQGSIFRSDLNICIPWARYAVYSVSCSILAFEIGTFQKFVPTVKLAFVFFITATLLTGVFVAISSTETNRYIWYGIGFATYIPALLILFLLSDPCNRLAWKGYSVWMLPIFVLITWSIYPIAFIFGPTLLNIFSTTIESWIYLGADLFTKIFFGFWISHLEYVVS